jgi:hypothetical protein
LHSGNLLFYRRAHRALLSRYGSLPWWPTQQVAKFSIEPVDLFFDRGGTLQLLWREIKNMYGVQ